MFQKTQTGIVHKHGFPKENKEEPTQRAPLQRQRIPLSPRDQDVQGDGAYQKGKDRI